MSDEQEEILEEVVLVGIGLFCDRDPAKIVRAYGVTPMWVELPYAAVRVRGTREQIDAIKASMHAPKCIMPED